MKCKLVQINSGTEKKWNVLILFSAFVYEEKVRKFIN